MEHEHGEGLAQIVSMFLPKHRTATIGRRSTSLVRLSLSKPTETYFSAIALPPACTTSTQRPMLRAFTVWSYMASQKAPGR